MKKNNFKSFDEILRTHLDKLDREGEHHNDCWYASECGFCKRKQVLRRIGLETSNISQYRFRFLGQDGNACHGWREEAAKKMGVVILSEEPLIDKKLQWRGRPDLLIELNGSPVMLDIKSQRSEAFWRRKKKPDGEKVEIYQQLQLASYIYFFNKNYSDILIKYGFPKGTKVKEGRIYFVDRGGGVREEYIFNFKKKIYQEVINELKILNKHWKDKVVPEIESKTWLCNYCPFQSLCQEIGKDKVEFPPANLVKKIKN